MFEKYCGVMIGWMIGDLPGIWILRCHFSHHYHDNRLIVTIILGPLRVWPINVDIIGLSSRLIDIGRFDYHGTTRVVVILQP